VRTLFCFWIEVNLPAHTPVLLIFGQQGSIFLGLVRRSSTAVMDDWVPPIELNDSRAVIVGLVNSGALFSSQVSIFSRYSAAKNFAAGGRNRMSFVIARSSPGAAPQKVAESITQETGFKAMPTEGFAKANSDYIIGNTGIPISFGTAVALGILVGIVVVALTFTHFI
jgi:putative ABC transport system permease protein